MENVMIAAMGLVAAAMLAVIFVYNGLDRRRFHLERMVKRHKEGLDGWARACEALRPGCAKAYFAARRLPDQMRCLRQMTQDVTENSEDKLDWQEQLLDFCYNFSQMADDYDRRLERPVIGKLGRLLGFRPVGGLDFYPDVTIEKTEQ